MASEHPPLVSGTILVDAPVRTVAAALAEPWLMRRALDTVGVRMRPFRGDQLGAGDELELSLFRLPLRLRVARADEDGLVLVSLGGGPRVRVRATTAVSDGGTLVTYGVGWTWHGVGTARGTASRLVRTLLLGVRDRAEQLVTAPVVVGAAITADGRVLAAQRDRPPSAAGRWEFPGGKVEPGEDERAALVRECREELAADITVDERLGPDLVLANGWVLRLYLARLTNAASPTAGEHRAIRWATADRLPTLNWLPPDRIVLPGLAVALRMSDETGVRTAGVCETTG
ncbi:MAG TPA: NUDIX domain-containing protein [Pseudonocardiaceae bacterium]|nr:NUDIX domain-containing protein [Pseudonocardiaceae bacterium]